MTYRDLVTELSELRTLLIGAADWTDEVHARHRKSVRNLAHFLAFRSSDLRDLQERLALAGVSSLGRSEAHVLATVDSVVAVLRAASGIAPEQPQDRNIGPDFGEGEALLAANTEALLGPASSGRVTRIMVTLPSEAAIDAGLVESYARSGTDIARINCAHDDRAAWSAMTRHVRSAARNIGRPIRVLMDLAGPKVRTGPIAPGPSVLRLRPTRDQLGRVTAPARARLVSSSNMTAQTGGLPLIPVQPTVLGGMTTGDVIELTDAREAQRTLNVVGIDGDGVLVETSRTIYFIPGTTLRHPNGECDLGALPATEGFLTLKVGAGLVITADLTPVQPDGEPLRIGCTLAQALASLESGHRVFLDDGKIGGVVESVGNGEALVRITSVPRGQARLRAEKGINLPDSELPIPALTPKDEDDLAIAVGLADAVGLSFVRRTQDVEALQKRLTALAVGEMGVVLKIETTEGFRNLPDLVRTAMRSPNVGVMIARGDLAVEAGYQRLAEVQEEILWLCEAAHLPVIWATEVLDRLARTGRPSRSEITDAAMAERAECVMLNKGSHLSEAIRVLADILVRMAALQHKKRPLLRQLRSWTDEPVVLMRDVIQ